MTSPAAATGPRPPPIERAKLLVVCSFLAVFTALDTVHNYVAHQGEGAPISVPLAIWWGLLFWLPYFPLVPAAVYLAQRYPLDFERAGSFVVHGAAGLVFAYLHLLAIAIMPLPARPQLTYGGRFFIHLSYDFALDYSVYCCVVAATYLLQRYSASKEREVQASQLETRLAQTHLHAIQAQLSPHFFFNTLQAISVLALAGERDSVVEMLSRLSGLIRVSFDERRPQQISLAGEMEFLESYLSIHQLSFGQRLTICYDVAPDTLDATVPNMLLQPLVENAIMHGVAVKPGACTLRITTRRHGATLVLEVADSGPGFPANGPQRKGVGLGATESRLQLLYEDSHRIDYGRSAEGGGNVTITIPYRVTRTDIPSRPGYRASA